MIFSMTQILREINFRDSISAKFAILTYLGALNFDVYEFLHFLKAEIYQEDNFRALKIAKMEFFTLTFSKIDFTYKSE